MKWIALYIFCSPLILIAQTGPGGVGTSLTNVFWLDANSGVTTVGPNVTGWTDRSGNANSASPPAAAARPTLVAANVNTFPSIDFDGGNDELRITDNASVDLTTWHFFIVASVDLQKDYNAWMTKGNDGSENFEMLSYGVGAGFIGNIHTPTFYTDATRTFPSTPAGMVVTGNVFNIIEYSYSSAVGRDVYKNFGSQYTDNENKTPQVNNFEIYIGNERTTAGRFLDGDIAEIIGFNAVQNAAQRTIVNNYLSSKYNIALTGSDFYAGDTGANGDYDFEVGGVGRNALGVTSTVFAPSVSGGLGITAVSGLGNGDYYFAGHNLKTGNNSSPLDCAGMTGTSNQRWLRIWYVDVTDADASTVTNVSFDMSDGGVSAVPAVASNYVLLRRAGLAGAWTESPIVPTIAGDVITFASVPLTDGYYTIGTKNSLVSPLPVELLSFDANYCNKQVCIEWNTSTESNNNYFDVEKSSDGVTFQSFIKVKSNAMNGNSTSKLSYTVMDEFPKEGYNYYRLKQVDFDGSFNYSKIVAINIDKKYQSDLIVFPNPSSQEFFIETKEIKYNSQVKVFLINTESKVVFEKSVNLSETADINLIKLKPESPLAGGVYVCKIVVDGIEHSTKIIIQ